MIALCPKMYFIEGAQVLKVLPNEDIKYKFSSKGIQNDKTDITKERFEKLLTDQNYNDVCTNKGFINYSYWYMMYVPIRALSITLYDVIHSREKRNVLLLR